MSDSDCSDSLSCESAVEYGRWGAIVGIFFAIIVVFLAVWFYSLRRARLGRPLMGTSWMLPRAVNIQVDREQNPESDPVPTYHERPGEGDAGYYDEHGNFVAFEPPPYVPKPPDKAIVHHRVHEGRALAEAPEEVELSNLTRN